MKPFSQDELAENWTLQLATLSCIAEQAGLPSQGVQGSLRDAQSFAEQLILCLDEPSASRCMLADREAALSFLQVAHELAAPIHRAEIEAEPEAPEHQTPFYLVCDGVLEMLRRVREEFPSEFA